MIGDKIKQVREINGWTQSEMAEKVGVQQTMIALIESGARMPSSELLARFVEATGYPEPFYSDEMSSDFPLGSLLYRTAKLTSEEKSRSHRLAQQTYELVKRMRLKLGPPIPLRIPRLIDEDAITAAGLLRSALGYAPDKPITTLVNRLEKNGVLVMCLPEAIESLEGFSVYVEDRPLIALSPNKPGDRQRLTLAHELGHIVLHQSFSGSVKELDMEATIFASEFLLPEEAMHSEMSSPLTISRLVELKPKWGVSLQMLVMTAKRLRKITARQATYLLAQISAKGWRKTEPPELAIPAEKPRLVRRMAEALYGDPINYRQLAADAYLPVFWVKRIIECHARKQDLNPPTATNSVTEIASFKSR